MTNILRNSETRFQYLSPVLSVVLVILGAVFIWWLIDRKPPLEGFSGTFLYWDENNPRRGVVLWSGIQRRSECTGRIYRYIVGGGETIALDPRPWEYRGPIEDPEKNPRTWEADFEVPYHVNHDAGYRNRIEFICNPFHKFMPIIVPAPDVPFSLPEAARRPGYVTIPRDDLPTAK